MIGTISKRDSKIPFYIRLVPHEYIILYVVPLGLGRRPVSQNLSCPGTAHDPSNGVSGN